MNINFSKIEKPFRPEGTSDTVQGNIGKRRITVKRSLMGWSPRLEIIIDDTRVHDSEPTESDKKQYSELYNRALDDRALKIELARADVIASPAFEAIFAAKE